MRLLASLVLLLGLAACDLGGSSPEGRWSLDADASWERNTAQLPAGLDELAQAARRRAMSSLDWELEFRGDGTLSSRVASKASSSADPILVEGSWSTEGERIVFTIVDPQRGPEVSNARLEDGVLLLSPPSGLGLPNVEFVFRRQS